MLEIEALKVRGEFVTSLDGSKIKGTRLTSVKSIDELIKKHGL